MPTALTKGIGRVAAATATDYLSVIEAGAPLPDIRGTAAPTEGPTALVLAAAVPTATGLAGATNIDIQRLSGGHGQFPLGIATGAARRVGTEAVGSALSAPNFYGNGGDAFGHDPLFGRSRVTELDVPTLARVHALTGPAFEVLAATRSISHRRIGTAAFRQTGIIGANFQVVAIEDRSRDALTLCADIPIRAGIAVVAHQVISRVYTALPGVTRVIRADIIIIAHESGAGHTGTVLALVPDGTGAAVVAFTFVLKMDATGFTVASVIGAAVFIVAFQRPTAFAPTSRTGIISGAGIAVITGSRIGSEGTADVGLTGVVGTGIAIITGQLPAASTLTQLAVVPSGTKVAIVARGRIQQMEAPLGSITRVRGTHIVIVAIQGRARLADPRSADIG